MTNNKKSTRYYSGRQERKVAKALNGKLVANSGAATFVAGDITTDKWLIECKTATTAKASFSIQREWMIKNKDEAFAMGKDYNALCFDYGPGTNRYYILDEKTFKKVVKLFKEADSEL